MQIAGELRRRRSLLRDGTTRLAGEIEDASLDEFMKRQLVDRLRYLLHVVDPCLQVRIQAAKCAGSVARFGLAVGRRSTSIVDVCFGFVCGSARETEEATTA